jgi:hypothetical protein
LLGDKMKKNTTTLPLGYGQDIYVEAVRGVLNPSVKKTSLRHVHVNSASKALASFKSAVSKPSVNQL